MKLCVDRLFVDTFIVDRVVKNKNILLIYCYIFIFDWIIQ